MAEDKKIAARLVNEEFNRIVAFTKQEGISTSIYSPGAPLPAVPDGGRGRLVNFAIGSRDDLTKTAARRMADVWRLMTKEYSNAIYRLQMFGFDDDPRQIWEVVDAARYVRRWAKYAGITCPEDITVTVVDRQGRPNLRFLAACGVFGEELRQQASASTEPTMKN
jgi:hypothetical protein